MAKNESTDTVLAPEVLLSHIDIDGNGSIDMADLTAFVLYHNMHPELFDEYMPVALDRLKEAGLLEPSDDESPSAPSEENLESGKAKEPKEPVEESIMESVLTEDFRPSWKEYGGFYDPATDKYHVLPDAAMHTNWVCGEVLRRGLTDQPQWKIWNANGLTKDNLTKIVKANKKPATIIGEDANQLLYYIAAHELHLVRIITNGNIGTSWDTDRRRFWQNRDIGIHGTREDVQKFVTKYAEVITTMFGQVYIDIAAIQNGIPRERPIESKHAEMGVIKYDSPEEGKELLPKVFNECYMQKKEKPLQEDDISHGGYLKTMTATWASIIMGFLNRHLIDNNQSTVLQRILDMVVRDSETGDYLQAEKDLDQLEQQLHQYGLLV